MRDTEAVAGSCARGSGRGTRCHTDEQALICSTTSIAVIQWHGCDAARCLERIDLERLKARTTSHQQLMRLRRWNGAGNVLAPSNTRRAAWSNDGAYAVGRHLDHLELEARVVVEAERVEASQIIQLEATRESRGLVGLEHGRQLLEYVDERTSHADIERLCLLGEIDSHAHSGLKERVDSNRTRQRLDRGRARHG